MRLILLTLLIGAAASADAPGMAATPPPEPTPVVRPEVVKKAIATAQRALKEQLAKDFPADKIVLREEEGPFGTVIAVAAYPGAYPGTGVRRVPIDATIGTTYGQHGERSFADFAREHDWLARPPATGELVRFLNTALFDGVAMLDSEPPPRVKGDSAALVIELVRRFMPSHAGEWLVVTVPKEGPELVERRPMQKNEQRSSP